MPVTSTTALVQLVTPMLNRGVSKHEAQRIHEQIVGDSDELDHASKKQLAEVSELFGRFFSGSGAKRWKELTGIGLSRGTVTYPKSFLPTQSVMSLRAFLAKQSKKIGQTYEVQRTRAGSVSVARTDGQDISFACLDSGRGASARGQAGIHWRQALKLMLPEQTFATFLHTGNPAVLVSAIDDLTELEATAGDNDGSLVPRDLKNASAGAKALMEEVYQQAGGRKKMALESIQRRLPAAMAALFRKPTNRNDPKLASLYAALTDETVGWLGAEYHRQVIVAADKTQGDFLDNVGISYHQSRGRLVKFAPQIFGKPDLKETAALWKARLEGRITNVAFLTIAQLSAPELAALKEEHGKLFPDGSDRSRAPRVRGAASPAEYDAATRKKRAEQVISAIETLLRDDVLLAEKDVVPLLNEDKKLVARWGRWTHNRLLNIRGEFTSIYPRFRTGRQWLPILTREVGALLKKQPNLTQAQVIAALESKHPRISRHHILAVSEENPDFFPHGGRARQGSGRKEQAELVAAKVHGYLKEDVLLNKGDLVRLLNADDDFVDRFGGAISGNRYGKLAGEIPGLFPDLLARDRWVPHLTQEIEALIAADPDIDRDGIFRALEARHPNMTRSRFTPINERHPDLLPNANAGHQARPNRKAARRIAALLKDQPTLTYPKIAKKLRPELPWLTTARVGDLVSKFPYELAAARVQARFGRKDVGREALCTRTLYSLLIRLLPPGTDVENITDIYNRQLERRGLKPYVSKGRQRNLESHASVFAETTSRIVAEYAQAAKKGSSADDILAAVQRDYPSISNKFMTAYASAWKEHPKNYPDLAPFFSGKRLKLVGHGKRLRKPRFIGGWKIDRAVLGGNAKEMAALAELAQTARIPLRLPMLDAALEDLGGSKPLKGKNLLMVSHLLASTVPLTMALREAGLTSPKTVIVGTPYGSNRTVRATLEDEGWDVRVPALNVEKYRAEVESALDDVVALHRKNGEPVVVMDDGGLVADLLHSKAKYADVRGAFKLVEQTTGGVIVAEKHALEVPIVNVARSKAKAGEGRFIGKSVATKVKQAIERSGHEMAGRKAVVIGYGVVGSALAKELREAGAEVTVIERSATRRKRANGVDGFAVAKDGDRVLAKAEIVVGCTGTNSLTLADLKKIKSGAVIASASSKQVEIDMQALKAAASSEQLLEQDNPLLVLPNVEYKLGRKTLTVLGDGWPVNFDGDVEDIAPEEIQLARALMFSGALQASALSSGKGLVAFDAKEDAKISKRFKALRGLSTGIHPLRDPGDWRQVILDLMNDSEDLIDPVCNERLVRATEIGKIVEGYVTKDPLLRGADIARLLNADAEVVARWGQWDTERYYRVSRQEPEQFPELRDKARWLPELTRAIKAILEKTPGPDNDRVLALLQQSYSHVGMTHVRVVAKAEPGLLPSAVQKPRPTSDDLNQRAQEAGKAAHRALKDDYLLSRDDIIEFLNQDKELVARWGEWNKGKYAAIAHADSNYFPDLQSRSRWLPLLEKEVMALQKKQPGINKSEVLRRLKKVHPRITHNHTDELALTYPKLFK